MDKAENNCFDNKLMITLECFILATKVSLQNIYFMKIGGKKGTKKHLDKRELIEPKELKVTTCSMFLSLKCIASL